MRSGIVANSEQLAILGRVVKDYCRYNAVIEPSERERVGKRALDLFAQGVRDETELVLRLLDCGTIH